MFNHLEYDTRTLGDEFLRDRQAGKPDRVPCNYFPENDPRRTPVNIWRPYGNLLVANWLGGIQRTASPRVSDEPLIQWALASPQTAYSDAQDHSAFLISGADSANILPSARGALGNAGIAPRLVKVHPRLQPSPWPRSCSHGSGEDGADRPSGPSRLIISPQLPRQWH